MQTLSVQFRGRLGYGQQSRRRYEEMCRDLEGGLRTVVFDLSQVPDINSEGIGFLVMCLATVERAGGQLRLAAPSREVRAALIMTGLYPVFAVFESVDAAVSERPR